MQDKVMWRLLGIAAATQLLFSIWPSIDLSVSRAFFQSDGKFWLAESALAEDLRIPIWLASVGLAMVAALMLAISLARGALAQTPWRLWAFVTALYLIGPGLLVNALLKQNWGRARPDAIEAFGGIKLFTPPFEIAGQCAQNCSFVSGEAASAAVMALVLAVLFGSAVTRPWRIALFVVLAGLFMLASGMRVASGRHFLSDVVFAGLFMAMIARALFLALQVSRVRNKALLSASWQDVAGLAGPRWLALCRSFGSLGTAKAALPDLPDALIDPVIPKA